jgi:hypothetical protein
MSGGRSKSQRYEREQQQHRNQRQQICRRQQVLQSCRTENPDRCRGTRKARELRQNRYRYAWHSEQVLFPPTHDHSPSRLSRIGHSDAGAHPTQALVNFCRVFFIDSSVLIFASMSLILASARFRTCVLVARGDNRSDSNSPISFRENPSSCARLMKRSRRAAS